MENDFVTIEKKEKERVNKIAQQLLEKPKMSILMVIFPMAVIPFIQQMKRYGIQMEILKKELFFLNSLALEAFKNSYSLENAEKFFKEIIFKPIRYSEIDRLYSAQVEEGMELYNWYLNYTEDEIPEKLLQCSLKSLKISREIFSENRESLEFSLKLERILNKI